MIFLSGKKTKCTDQIGVMLSFNAGHTITYGHSLFAADNGCFAQAGKYTNVGFLAWLDKLDRSNCLFAVAPDVLGDAMATKDRAYPMLPLIKNLGFKAAYVCQDGERINLLNWSLFDAIFIGGTTEWKLSQAAADLVAEAKRRNKWVHMGRVNSYKRMRLASAIGCDSTDGTTLSFAPDQQRKSLENWLFRLNNEPLLKLV